MNDYYVFDEQQCDDRPVMRISEFYPILELKTVDGAQILVPTNTDYPT